MFAEISSKTNCAAFGSEGQNGKQNSATVNLRTHLYSLWTTQRPMTLINNRITVIQMSAYRQSPDNIPAAEAPLLLLRLENSLSLRWKGLIFLPTSSQDFTRKLRRETLVPLRWTLSWQPFSTSSKRRPCIKEATYWRRFETSVHDKHRSSAITPASNFTGKGKVSLKHMKLSFLAVIRLTPQKGTFFLIFFLDRVKYFQLWDFSGNYIWNARWQTRNSKSF